MDNRHTIKNVCFLLLAASCTLGTRASGGEPTTRSVFRSFVVANRPPIPLDSAKFAQIRDGMTLGEIVDDLGPGWMSPNESCGVITWFFKDGRQLQVRPREYKRSEVITEQGASGRARMWVEPLRPLVTKTRSLDLGNGVNMLLLRIPAGEFLMGSFDPKGDPYKDQVLHEVTLTSAFYMGITPVTVDQFAAFVKDSGYRTEAETAGVSAGFEIKADSLQPRAIAGCSWRSPGFEQKGNHPVVQISWNDAQAFCRWMSKRSGKTVALPTEAQWEYACRAGTKTIYPWGDNADDGKGWGNCADESFEKKLGGTFALRGFNWDDSFVFTSPVGRFKANAYGLYDMIGNVKQWCQDWYGDYGKNMALDPSGPVAGRARVVRGASWLSIPGNCGSASRNRDAPDNRECDIGFRVVVVASGED